jgi:hypothetical protein
MICTPVLSYSAVHVLEWSCVVGSANGFNVEAAAAWQEFTPVRAVFSICPCRCLRGLHAAFHRPARKAPLSERGSYGRENPCSLIAYGFPCILHSQCGRRQCRCRGYALQWCCCAAAGDDTRKREARDVQRTRHIINVVLFVMYTITISSPLLSTRCAFARPRRMWCRCW